MCRNADKLMAGMFLQSSESLVDKCLEFPHTLTQSSSLLPPLSRLSESMKLQQDFQEQMVVVLKHATAVNYLFALLSDAFLLI